ncbi:hypothetical protein D5396_00195 [Rahnella inusitata]|uniref:Secreted protein n=1 Tax=Rahnella inusitata TaxID=58169 RepID=A0ABX9P5I1_9GAMM|nr:hypothetical protein D5396_00195 [Rahnella inusitata]
MIFIATAALCGCWLSLTFASQTYFLITYRYTKYQKLTSLEKPFAYAFLIPTNFRVLKASHRGYFIQLKDGL